MSTLPISLLAQRAAWQRLRLCFLCLGISLPYSQAVPIVSKKQLDHRASYPARAQVDYLQRLLRKHLPLRPAYLTLGQFSAKTVSSPLPRPLFVIGSDAFSLQWLAQHKQRLLAINAVGLLIEASDINTVHTVAQAAFPLPLSLGRDEVFAKALGVEHYPFLAHRRGVEQ